MLSDYLPDEETMSQNAIAQLLATSTLEQDSQTISELAKKMSLVQSYKKYRYTVTIVDSIVSKWEMKRATERLGNLSPEFYLIRRARIVQAALKRQEKRIIDKYNRQAAERRAKDEASQRNLIRQEIAQLRSMLAHNERRKQLEKQVTKVEKLESGRIEYENMMIEGAKERLEFEDEEARNDLEIREQFGITSRREDDPDYVPIRKVVLSSNQYGPSATLTSLENSRSRPYKDLMEAERQAQELDRKNRESKDNTLVSNTVESEDNTPNEEATNN